MCYHQQEMIEDRNDVFHLLRLNSWYQVERTAVFFSFFTLYQIWNLPQESDEVYIFGFWLCVQADDLFWPMDQVGGDRLHILKLGFRRPCMLDVSCIWHLHGKDMLRPSCWPHRVGESIWNTWMGSFSQGKNNPRERIWINYVCMFVCMCEHTHILYGWQWKKKKNKQNFFPNPSLSLAFPAN